jgi:IS30 family transposase
MAHVLKMAKIPSIEQLHAAGWSRRRIAEALAIDRGTVRDTCDRRRLAQMQPFRPPGLAAQMQPLFRPGRVPSRHRSEPNEPDACHHAYFWSATRASC